VPDVLRQRNFLSYYVGQSLSLLGDAILPVALAFAVLDMTDSPSALGPALAGDGLPACPVAEPTSTPAALVVAAGWMFLSPALLHSVRAARGLPPVPSR
jgi:hypothetical protein